MSQQLHSYTVSLSVGMPVANVYSVHLSVELTHPSVYLSACLSSSLIISQPTCLSPSLPTCPGSLCSRRSVSTISSELMTHPKKTVSRVTDASPAHYVSGNCDRFHLSFPTRWLIIKYFDTYCFLMTTRMFNGFQWAKGKYDGTSLWPLHFLWNANTIGLLFCFHYFQTSEKKNICFTSSFSV